LIVGAFQESTYTEGQLNLQPGDRLVMFTDGVTEAVNGEDGSSPNSVAANLTTTPPS